MESGEGGAVLSEVAASPWHTPWTQEIEVDHIGKAFVGGALQIAEQRPMRESRFQLDEGQR